MPDPLPPPIVWSAELAATLSTADRALGRLAGDGRRLPNPHLLIRPFVRREASGWRMFVGAAHRDGTAMALSWTSSDLRSWSYDGVVLSRPTAEHEPVWMGALWECPQFFEVDGVDVMVSSVWDADVLHYAGYATGAYRGGRFTAHGRAAFAPGNPGERQRLAVVVMQPRDVDLQHPAAKQ